MTVVPACGYRNRTLPACLIGGLVAVLAISPPASAAECPVAGADATIEAIKAAPSCKEAAEIYAGCTWGSSMDVQFGSVAIEKCEGAFLANLSAKRKQTYRQDQARCTRKYARKQGTLYLSLAMSCAVDVAKTYWQQALKADGREKSK